MKTITDKGGNMPNDSCDHDENSKICFEWSSKSFTECMQMARSKDPYMAELAVRELAERVKKQNDIQSLQFLLDEFQSDISCYIRVVIAENLDHEIENSDFATVVLDHLINHLISGSEDQKVRVACANSILEYKHPKALAALSEVLLNDHNIDLRVCIAELLELVINVSDSVVEILMSALHDSSWKVRAASVNSISFSNDERIWDALFDRLSNDSSAHVRERAAMCMSGLPKHLEGKGLSLLMESLLDKSWRPRWGATMTLCMLGLPGAIDAANNVLSDHSIPRAEKDDIKALVATYPLYVSLREIRDKSSLYKEIIWTIDMFAFNEQISKPPSYTNWNKFGSWLLDKLGCPHDSNWALEFANRFPEDTEAIEQWHSLFTQFIDSIDKSGDVFGLSKSLYTILKND